MKKCASNREIHIHTIDVLLVRRFVCFIHTRIHRSTMHTSTLNANRWKKYRNNSLCLSLSLFFLDTLPAFVLLLRLEVSTSIITTTTSTIHIHYSIWSLSSVRQGANETSVQERFCFAKKKGIALLDVDVVVVSSAIEYFTCSCLCVVLCVCVCVCVCGGQILFPVNCGGRRRFFSSSFHSHSHMPLIFFSLILLPKKKKNEKYFYSSYIRTYFNSFIIFSSSSFSYVITHPFFLLLLQSYLLHTFYFPSIFLHTCKLIECHHIYEEKKKKKPLVSDSRRKSTYTQATKSN